MAVITETPEVLIAICVFSLHAKVHDPPEPDIVKYVRCKIHSIQFLQPNEMLIYSQLQMVQIKYFFDGSVFRSSYIFCQNFKSALPS